MTDIQKALWDKSIIGLAQVDKTGTFVKANPVFCQLLGYSEAELQDKTWMSITHPDDLDGGMEMFNRILTENIADYKMEKRYITKRGYVIWVDVAVDVVRQNDNIEILLKQVIGNKILIPDSTTPTVVKKPKLKETIKEHYKIILATIVGTIFTIYGAYTNNTDIQNIGLGITLGIFGGVMAKR